MNKRAGRGASSMLVCAVALLYLVAASRIGWSAPAGVWPVSTGFEQPEYQLGNLDAQNGWQASPGVEVQTSIVRSGTRAVRLAAGSTASYGVTDVTETVVWFQTDVNPDTDDQYLTLPAPAGSSCVLLFHATDGITCLDGDGAGYGTWQTTGIQPAGWTTVTVRQDYANHSWDLYVDAVPVLAGLGNAYYSASPSKLEYRAGGASSLCIDDFYFGSSTPAWVPTESAPVAGTLCLAVLATICGLLGRQFLA